MWKLITNLPALNLFVFVALGMILFSLVALLLIRRYRLVSTNYQDDPVLGNIGTLIGTIYGVLAGLTALYLVNNIAFTADAVQREANAVADIYRDSRWLKDPQRTQIQTETKKYIDNVMTVEWPLMQNGEPVGSQNDLIIDKISGNLFTYDPSSNSESLLVHDMLDEIRLLYNARQQRIHMSNLELNPEIWFVVLVGTALTLGINFLFRMSFYLHVAAISATALMASAVIFLLVSLDRPFQGDFIVEPEAFDSVLALIKAQNKAEVGQTVIKPTEHKIQIE